MNKTEEKILRMETDLQVKYVRFSFVSEIGGTAATLDVVYLGSA